MKTKFNRYIYNFCVSLLILFSSSVSAEHTIQFVETTGRAVITDESSVNEARRHALEDAIFLAAIHGGAKIDGFSSIDKETNLTEHFTIRPAGELLDYSILEEMIDGEHFKTTIRAAVGAVSKTECSARTRAKIVKFGADYNFSGPVPAWLRQTSQEIETALGQFLRDQADVVLTDVSPITLNIDQLTKIDDAFDYASLTRGRIRVASGDFALVPSISMRLSKSKKNIETEIFLLVSIASKLFSGDDYSFVESANYEIMIKLKSETPWRTFDILGKKTRDQIKLSITNGLHGHVKELMKKVQCIPLTAKIKLQNKKLVVNLGESHGISTNSLAVSTGTNTAYSILHVTEVFENQAVIEPLNKSLEMTALVGKTINFME